VDSSAIRIVVTSDCDGNETNVIKAPLASNWIKLNIICHTLMIVERYYERPMQCYQLYVVSVDHLVASGVVIALIFVECGALFPNGINRNHAWFYGFGSVSCRDYR
jgi:hypothetical protein